MNRVSTKIKINSSPIPNPQSPVPNPQSPVPNPQSPKLRSQSPHCEIYITGNLRTYHLACVEN
ncbi:hypothetical protein H6G64_31885 [Calothrix sp. FACHB-156]|nr:hypothetical protein [Calothrix sp. FACHB-156]